MEQAGCWLVPNRPPKCSSDESSWEERAFAEDIGGCVWPPRSYSCNFCRREFRSAQALGGHMNVHRRDRARLKLLSNTTKSNHLSNNQSNNFSPHNNNKDQNPSLFSSSNNPESHHFVSSFLVNKNTHEKTLSFFCLSNNDTNGKNNKDLLPFKITKNHDMMMKASNNNHPFIGLSTGSVAAADDDDEAPNNPNKKRKVDTSSPSPSVVTKITKKFEDHTPKKVNVSHEIEELDLELRLGDPPKLQ